jgi:NTP pyrophosphatase (non-canonical NTP hydrolase)
MLKFNLYFFSILLYYIFALLLIYKKYSTMNATTKFDLIREWAQERGIYDKGDVKTQFCKLGEEFGELGHGIIKQHDIEIKDAIGDMVVVLTNLAHLAGFKIEDCIDHAYDEIKVRTGQMINGSFVKDKPVQTEVIPESAFNSGHIIGEPTGRYFKRISVGGESNEVWGRDFKVGNQYKEILGKDINPEVNTVYLEDGLGYRFYVDADSFEFVPADKVIVKERDTYNHDA